MPSGWLRGACTCGFQRETLRFGNPGYSWMISDTDLFPIFLTQAQKGFLCYLIISYTSVSYFHLTLFFTPLQEAVLLSLFAQLVPSYGSLLMFHFPCFSSRGIFYISEKHKGAIYLKIDKCMSILMNWWIKNKPFSLQTLDVSIFWECKNQMKVPKQNISSLLKVQAEC